MYRKLYTLVANIIHCMIKLGLHMPSCLRHTKTSLVFYFSVRMTFAKGLGGIFILLKTCW